MLQGIAWMGIAALLAAESGAAPPAPPPKKATVKRVKIPPAAIKRFAAAKKAGATKKVEEAAARVKRALMEAEKGARDRAVRRPIIRVKPDEIVAPAKAEARAKPKKPEKAEKPAEAPEAPTAPPEPMPPLFRMRDDSRIAGVLDAAELQVDTAYGRLVVPVEEIVRIRLARRQDPKIQQTVAREIERLGSDDYDEREAATEALRKIGMPALAALKQAAKSEDEEVRTRAEALLEELQENLEELEDEDPSSAPLLGEDDEIETRRFTIRGRVLKESYRVKSRYGEFQVNRADIVSITFIRSAGVHSRIKIPATATTPSGWVDTKVDVTRGAGLRIKASGTIHVEAYGETATPDGNRRIGNRFMSFPSCALVGKIGRNGSPFLVGSDYDDTIEEPGRLYLAIAFQRSGGMTGRYAARIDVEPAE